MNELTANKRIEMGTCVIIMVWGRGEVKKRDWNNF